MEKPYVIQEVKNKEPTKIPLKVFQLSSGLPRYNLEHMASYQQGNTLPTLGHKKQTSSGVQRKGEKEHFSAPGLHQALN